MSKYQEFCYGCVADDIDSEYYQDNCYECEMWDNNGKPSEYMTEEDIERGNF